MRDALNDRVNTEIDIGEFRQLLMKRRDELKARNRRLLDMGDVPDLDEYGYDAGDRAVQADDKDRAGRLTEAQRAELYAVDAALTRIEEGTYGECVSCGENISAARLRAVPQTALCVACAELDETEHRQSPHPTM